MNAQCNAFYGTAPSRRDCLTTLKSSEGNCLLSAVLYRNATPHAIAAPCCPTLLWWTNLYANNRKTFNTQYKCLKKPLQKFGYYGTDGIE